MNKAISIEYVVGALLLSTGERIRVGKRLKQKDVESDHIIKEIRWDPYDKCYDVFSTDTKWMQPVACVSPDFVVMEYRDGWNIETA